MRQNDVILVSGGIDSVILGKHWVDGTPVFIDYGQPEAEEEYHACKIAFQKDLVKLDVKMDIKRDQEGIYIPNRNLTFASLASTMLDPERIYIAGLRDDNSVDKTPEAFERMSELLTRFAGHPVKVIGPFFQLSKGELVEDYINAVGFGHAARVLIETFSCYSPVNGKECKDCEACFRKWVALASNGIEVEPVSNGIVSQYLGKLHRYDKDRISRTLIALKSIGEEVHAVDIDGTLCEEDSDIPYEDRRPIRENINKVNRMKGIVVLYTSRLEADRSETEQWLMDEEVSYNVLIMNKIPYIVLLDDRVEKA